jgi:hypothetical protein
MTGKSAFTTEEWKLIREGPPLAGLMVITAEGGGTFRETFAMARAYTDAREQHGESELLDELVAAGPERGPRYHSSAEVREQGLQLLRDAADVLRRKAAPEEVEDYRKFVISLAEKVAAAHKEEGEPVSERERAAIDEISTSLSSAAAS